MSREYLVKSLAFGFWIIATGGSVAQTPSLSLLGRSGTPGDSITLTVSLSYNGATRPAAVQWDLNYSTADLLLANGTFFSTGMVATAAGKSVTCGVPTPGSVRCIVWGVNKASIMDGALASLRFQIAPSTSSSSTTVSFAKIQGADRNGAAVNMNGAVAIVAITQPPSAFAPQL
jgi:hypothetical protein